MSGGIESVVDSESNKIIQKELFLFLLGKFINKKELRRFSVEYSPNISFLPPIDIYLKRSFDEKEIDYYIEVKAGRNINNFEEFCKAIFNFYKLINYFKESSEDLDNKRFIIFHSWNSNHISHLKFLQTSHRNKSAVRFRNRIKQIFMEEITDRIEKKPINSNLLKYTLKKITTKEMDEEMIIDDFKYTYWEPVFVNEIQKKYNLIYNLIDQYNKYRRKYRDYKILFDQYLFNDKFGMKSFDPMSSAEFVSEHKLSSDLLVPYNSTTRSIYDKRN